MERLKITDTTLRDGHQSLWATRMRLEDMLPILERIDQIGYHSLEVWGGATFDVCLRFLNEDPWERLRVIRQKVKKTKLQMLLRGQSLVGYSHYPDDVVERFVVKAAENGIDIFRIFDALNDIRNLEKAMQVAKETGKHVQASVVYTISPVHTLEHYVETALKLEDRAADSICIKDMAGLLSPYRAFELISALKARLRIPVQLHTHYTGGMAVATYLKAAEAGVDVVDTATGPLAFGSSQPPVETMVRVMQESPRQTGLDLSQLFEISDYFEDVRIKRGHERGITRISHLRVFEHQVPGGMISNLVAQLEEQQALNRLPEVLVEIARVREELGYPPLVTPTSQIVGTQAAVNVLTGKRYGMVPGEVRKYVQGYYGKVPGEIKPDIRKKILGKTQAIECRPADLIEPRLQQCREEIGSLAQTEEDLLSYALFPMVAKKFLEEKANKPAQNEDN
jgi:oxaloacetate decarboxylase alpha subunit